MVQWVLFFSLFFYVKKKLFFPLQGPEDELLARIYVLGKLAHCGKSVFFNAVPVGFFFPSLYLSLQIADELSLHSLASNQVFKEANQRKRVVAGSAPQTESS